MTNNKGKDGVKDTEVSATTNSNFEVVVDGKVIVAKKKSTLLQLCSSVNKFLPRFCYHGKLSVVANCRMCLVQVEESKKLVASCAFDLADGMKVFTNTNVIKKSRESVLEFLLINHPLDCPICDQGGECDLQDQTVMFGSDRGRFYEFKRAVKDITMGFIVKTFMNRCIHCTRCIRFANEILAVYEVGLIGRGNNMRVSTFLNRVFRSELSGNITDVCPVGALTLKPYAFKARPWELRGFLSLDVFDAFASNIRVDVRGLEVMRVLPYFNNDVNEEFITDKARLFFDGLLIQRLYLPIIKAVSQKLDVTARYAFNPTGVPINVLVSWNSMIYLILKKFNDWNVFFVGKKQINYDFGLLPKNIFLVSFGSSSELDIFIAIKDFFNFFSIPSFSNSMQHKKYFLFKPIFRSNYLFSFGLQRLSQLSSFIFLGFNAKVESPIFNFKLNRLSFKKNISIFSISVNNDTQTNVNVVGLSVISANFFFRGRLSLCKFLLKSAYARSKKREAILDSCLLFGQSMFYRNDFTTFSILADLIAFNISDIWHTDNIFSDLSELSSLEVNN